jgi:hypothetical protein
VRHYLRLVTMNQEDFQLWDILNVHASVRAA